MIGKNISNSGRAIRVLLIEDNPNDVFITQRAFGSLQSDIEIFPIAKGEDALEFLAKQNKFTDVERPDLILLDLNLPGISGKEVLTEIKNDTYLRLIPVIVITSSRAERDIIESYGLHANSYLIKPSSLNEFQKMATAIEKYWFTSAIYPGKSDAFQ